MRKLVLVVAGVALAIRLPLFFASRHLSFDDGVYGASAIAMRDGGIPFRSVFSSQPPLFLPLVYVADFLGLRQLNSPRVLAVVAGIASAVGASFIASFCSDRRWVIFGAGFFTASSGTLLWTTGPITSNGPGEALAVWAVVAALWYRRVPGIQRALVVGLLAGAAVATKSLLVLPAVSVAWLLLTTRRHRMDWLWAPLVGIAVTFISALPFGLSNVWDEAVLYHTDASQQRTYGANAAKLWGTLWERDTALMVLAFFVLASIVVSLLRKQKVSFRFPVGYLLGWLGFMIVILIVEAPMWRNHVAHVIVPAAVLLALYARTFAVVAYTIALLGQATYMLTHAKLDYEGDSRKLVAELRTLPPNAQVISDEPGFVWRAGLRTPDEFVDASVLRIDSTRPNIAIDTKTLTDVAARKEVCAVVVWSSRFGNLPGLPQSLHDIGYRPARQFGDRRVLWEKENCTN